MSTPFTQLKDHLAEVHDLHATAAVLYWDQATYMPAGGAAGRGRQLATLSKLAQEKFTTAEVGRLLEALEPYEQSLPYDHADAALIRVARRDYERARKLPAALVAEITEHTTHSYQAWTTARPANNFAVLEPLLQKTLDLTRRAAQCYGVPTGGHIADPLIAENDYGMSVAILRPLFAELRGRLTPLVQRIQQQPEPDAAFLHRSYPTQRQREFGEEVIRCFGYDFERGRQDKTHHPFMISFSLGDVRITTRFQEYDLGDGLFSTMHEAGHALYEQGINPAYEGTLLAGGISAGVHESQSRLWENLVGRSRAFWQHYYPRLQAEFPAQLGDVTEQAFYRAINCVKPSLIRVDADEVTYNLHVIIRFELELALLEGSLAVKDVAEAWRASYRDYLGIAPPDDKDGVMQDMHWYAGMFGGVFQGYTLGNIMSVAFWQAARADLPTLEDDIAAARFDGLRGWLQQHIHHHGRSLTAAELVERVTGAPLSIEPYMAYLHHKFGELYAL